MTKAMMRKYAFSWQAHLTRIAPYLEAGQGGSGGKIEVTTETSSMDQKSQLSGQRVLHLNISGIHPLSS